MKPVTAHATPLQDLVARARHHQNLAQVRTALNISGLLEQISADSSGGLTEKFRDIEDAQLGGRPEARWQFGPRDIESGCRGETWWL